MTSSTSGGDVTVMAETGAAVCGRPPPPPYQLRPRRQTPHSDEDEIIHRRPGKIRSVGQREEITAARDAGQRQPAAAVRVTNETELQRPTSLVLPRRRRAAAAADSAQKDLVCTVIAESPPIGSSAVASMDPTRPSPARSLDTSVKNPRTCVLLRRRSLTISDRDWHRELVNQYTSGRPG